MKLLKKNKEVFLITSTGFTLNVQIHQLLAIYEMLTLLSLAHWNSIE